MACFLFTRTMLILASPWVYSMYIMVTAPEARIPGKSVLSRAYHIFCKTRKFFYFTNGNGWF